MGFLKHFFGSKLPPFDYGVFNTDIHSHLIPEIDDGSQSMDETISLLRKFKEMGYKKVITTPHVMSDYYQNTPEIILGGLEKVRTKIREMSLDIEIDAAAEYYYDEFLIQKILNKEVLTFAGDYLLFEFSFTAKPTNVSELIFTLKTNDYKPILAHFERYPYYFNDGLEKAKEFRDQGVLIQLNLTSLAGHYGKKVVEQAQMLVDNGLVDVVGSDCHRIDHLNMMEDNNTNEYLHKLGEMDLLNKRVL